MKSSDAIDDRLIKLPLPLPPHKPPAWDATLRPIKNLI
jgi:hypothetical protein